MTLPTSALSVGPIVDSGDCTPAEMLAALGVSHEQFGNHQEQMRQSFLSPQSTSSGPSLPFPLNLPPSYPPYLSASASTAPTRRSRPPYPRQGASVTPSHTPKMPEAVREEYTRAPSTPNASYPKGKGKRTLDAFMDSRQGTRVQEPDSSGSDSDTSLRKMLALPQIEGSQNSDSSALPSSSPPSSSPLRTPRESSPLRSMYPYPASPTPASKRQSSTRVDASALPYTLPPGPYSREKPSWSLAALIGQAINASQSSALPLNDIYSYISTVYPYYDRGDQPWMSSVRHSLSVNEAFCRVADLEKNVGTRGRGKGKTRLKGGLWRIKPGHEGCFVDGNFVRKGAKGSGPGKNLGGRKRAREDDDEPRGRKTKSDQPSSSRTHSPSPPNQNLASRPLQSQPRSPSPSPRTIYSAVHGERSNSASPTLRPSSPPSLTASHDILPSDSSLPEPLDLTPSSPSMAEHQAHASVVGSPDLPLALMLSRRNSATKADCPTFTSSLEPGFELTTSTTVQCSDKDPAFETRDFQVNQELFTRVLASTSSAYASSSREGPSCTSKPPRLLFPPPFPPPPLAGSSSSPARPTTPPPRQTHSSGVTLSPIRTPVSHRGLHMSPSRSLAHYKSSLEPEWKAAGHPTTPSRDSTEAGDAVSLTPKRSTISSGFLNQSPFRTPARPLKQRPGRGYDPYDPNTLLADELASIRDANEPQESPGGFFGKEGRKLLYDSPSVPGRSNWRFRDDI